LENIKMRTIYIALGLNPEGTTLMLKPIVPGSDPVPMQVLLSDMAAKGMDEANAAIGHMLLAALGAYHRDLRRFDIFPPPPQVPPFPKRPPLPRGCPMRSVRIGVGLVDDPVDPGLLIKTFSENIGIGEGELRPFSLAMLAGHGPSAAPGLIGAIALIGLSALHADAFAPYPQLFEFEPMMAPPQSGESTDAT
jgi:hypothetical protein